MRSGFIIVPSALDRTLFGGSGRPLTPTDKYIYDYMLGYAFIKNEKSGKTERCPFTVSLGRACEETGLNRSTISRSIARMEKIGLVVRSTAGVNQWMPGRYEIVRDVQSIIDRYLRKRTLLKKRYPIIF